MRDGLSRRRALKVIAAGAAGAASLPHLGCTDPGDSDSRTPGREPVPAAGNPLAANTPTDPDLVRPSVPWDGVLTSRELALLAVLCDAILPADDRSPSASELGAPAFIDEWVSAPYEGNREDLTLVRGGLAWLEVESSRRFQRDFASLDPGQTETLLDDIAHAQEARPEHRAAARFFDKVRDLTATAVWTTPEGMTDLGFVGNRPLPAFEGPPADVLRQLGLAPS